MDTPKQVTGEMRTLKGVTGGIDGPERPEDAAFYRRVLCASAEDAVRVVRALVPVHSVLRRHLVRFQTGQIKEVTIPV